MFTRCPHCQTTYRVHPEQLSSASGLVRCGKCQGVFQSLDHLFDIQHSPYPVTPPKAVNPLEGKAASQQPADTDTSTQAVTPNVEAPADRAKAPTHAPMVGDEERVTPEESPATSVPQGDDEEQPPFSTSLTPQAANPPSGEKGETPADDEPETFQYISLGGLDDDVLSDEPSIEKTHSEDLLTNKPMQEPQEPQEPQSSLFSHNENEKLFLPISDNILSHELSADRHANSETEHFFSALKQTSTTTQQTGEESSSQPDVVAESPSAPFIGPLPQTAVTRDHETEQTLPQSGPVSEPADTPFIGPLPQESQSQASKLLEEEIEQLQQLPPHRHPMMSLLYLLLSLLLITTLTLQLTYFNRIELAKYPELRPWLEQGCSLAMPYLPAQLPCDIPLQSDLNAFEILDRDIRSHSDIAEALTVNVLFSNNATFTQAYPRLHLEFQGINGKTIAQRHFTTGEYLKNNLNTDKGIAPNSKIQAQFDIVDPGSDAVNFIFSFR